MCRYRELLSCTLSTHEGSGGSTVKTDRTRLESAFVSFGSRTPVPLQVPEGRLDTTAKHAPEEMHLKDVSGATDISALQQPFGGFGSEVPTPTSSVETSHNPRGGIPDSQMNYYQLIKKPDSWPLPAWPPRPPSCRQGHLRARVWSAWREAVEWERGRLGLTPEVT